MRRKFGGPPREAAPTSPDVAKMTHIFSFRPVGAGSKPAREFTKSFPICCRGRLSRRPEIFIRGGAATFLGRAERKFGGRVAREGDPYGVKGKITGNSAGRRGRRPLLVHHTQCAGNSAGRLERRPLQALMKDFAIITHKFSLRIVGAGSKPARELPKSFPICCRGRLFWRPDIAPLEGCDNPATLLCLLHRHFNPRTPYGVRLCHWLKSL